MRKAEDRGEKRRSEKKAQLDGSGTDAGGCRSSARGYTDTGTGRREIERDQTSGGDAELRQDEKERSERTETTPYRPRDSRQSVRQKPRKGNKIPVHATKNRQRENEERGQLGQKRVETP
jgi:hypothetical protein